jgi:hypothetical protein
VRGGHRLGVDLDPDLGQRRGDEPAVGEHDHPTGVEKHG